MLDWHGFLCVCVRRKYVYARCVYVRLRMCVFELIADGMYVHMCEMCVRVHVEVHVRVREKADGKTFFMNNEVVYVSNITKYMPYNIT
jgi:hypothetical protein